MAEKIITVEEHLLWVIFHQVHDLLIKYENSEVFSKQKTTREQFLILLLMEFMDTESISPITITDLTSGLCRNINSTSAIVDRMTQKGLISKIRDLQDRRTIRLTITTKGKQVFKSAVKPDMRLRKKVLTVFSKQDIQTLLSLLKKLKGRLGEESNLPKIKVDPEFSERALVSKFLNDTSA